MKICYYVFFCDDEIGEVDAFFTEKLELIHWWDCNDAHYRDEYMNSLLVFFGVKMIRLPEKLEDKALKIFKKEYNG